MRGIIIGWALTILICLTLLPVAAAQTPTNDGPLTNAAIIKLVRAKFKDKTIITIIESRNSNFDLSTERMIELKRAGVSEKVILAMLAHQQGMAIDSLWDDEVFFKDGVDRKEAPTNGKPPADSGTSTDIFGSSGGSSGGTRSRGGNSSTSGDTLTTGSATVRIIRPPSEAGAPVKLEKVATLTNDSVVELVDAGFSEGTIIRRIEQSPVEFDLSPSKIADLRKRRVSDKVLSAMKAAAGEDETKLPRSNVRPAQ
jgi:hypothetical protein